jgi:TfoX/Sxy family transcriptional regulator of competence genes
MAYDEELAERIRAALADHRGITEQRMFGGLAFLVNGNMAVAASGQGGLLVRVDPDQSDKLVDGGKAEPMVMKGRVMRGWLRVPADDVRTKRDLAMWVKRGSDYAGSLPAKKAKKAKTTSGTAASTTAKRKKR